ncbi:hypothetical protein L0P92_26185, partial [Streptomyces muensis]|nr:hypothetical protein [Streptomyces muensis]
MRYRFVLPRHLAAAFAAGVTLAGLLSTPALAAPATETAPSPVATDRRTPPPPPTGSTAHTTVRDRARTPGSYTHRTRPTNSKTGISRWW